MTLVLFEATIDGTEFIAFGCADGLWLGRRHDAKCEQFESALQSFGRLIPSRSVVPVRDQSSPWRHSPWRHTMRRDRTHRCSYSVSTPGVSLNAFQIDRWPLKSCQQVLYAYHMDTQDLHKLSDEVEYVRFFSIGSINGHSYVIYMTRSNVRFDHCL